LIINIKDKKGEPVEDAKVAVRYSMPAMGSMPEMKGEAQVEEEDDGRYRAKFDLPMGGTWTLDLDIKTEKQGAATARYTLTIGTKGLTEVGAAKQAAAPGPEPLPAYRFNESVLASLRTAYEAYEEIRARLASDSLEGIGPRGHRVAEILKAAAAQTDSSPVQKELLAGADAAHRVAAVDKLEAARAAFGDLSRTLVLLAACDERLAEGHHVFECPMVEGFNKWLQTNQEIANPYMGPKMLQCGSKSQLPSAAADPHAGHSPDTSGGGEIAYYTCPMHPSIKQPTPGTCPICSMDLTPVTKTEVETGVIFVDAARRQLIGVKTTKVERRNVQKSIRTVGKITYDETRLVDVSLKFQGWIGQLKADATGQRVKRGQTLFTVYSPEVYAAQQDLLIASRSQPATTSTDTLTTRNGSLVDAARRRLKLWDISAGVINQVIKKGEPLQYVPVASPSSGFIVEKNVVAGSSVEPGARLFRIADLKTVWIEAELYEAELPLIKLGQAAKVTLSYLPDKQFEGKISFVYPYLTGTTRTGQVRIELDNPDVELKPDMYANVEFQLDRGERLVIPESAVVYAGPRRIVFLDLGEGKLRSQEVEIGVKSGEFYEVIKGLNEGQEIVTSGNFLIAAESRLKSATGQW
jgi:Cu(I)/Ag(I) efflux system membrane fusion protein